MGKLASLQQLDSVAWIGSLRFFWIVTGKKKGELTRLA